MLRSPAPDLLAVLIDAENVPAKYAEAMFTEIATLGEASIRRIYGDFSGPTQQGWTKEILAKLAINPYQQFQNTRGKNAGDIALVIDAMDILHSGRFDGFVLISSDSDFTRLASRIREHGLDVYGFGEKKTPESFRNSCKRFIFVENLLEEDTQHNNNAQSTKLTPTKAVPLILKVLRGLDDKDGWYGLGPIGKQLLANNPDFDPRNYGCAKLVDLVGKTGAFEVIRKDNGVLIRPKQTKPKATK